MCLYFETYENKTRLILENKSYYQAQPLMSQTCRDILSFFYVSVIFLAKCFCIYCNKNVSDQLFHSKAFLHHKH